MTRIIFTRKNGRIARVECDGHTGYGVEGEDIVCAALSSIVQTAVLGVLGVAKVNADYRIDEEKGNLTLSIPDNISAKQADATEIILSTLLLGVSDLHEGYSDFIEMEVK
ncbi:MAG: ribosomal-processing cysteine protease Prp [Clostridia bacterium]|nr:ribosomal-processing cysteine protease Prp [Clostridia bacterium]